MPPSPAIHEHTLALPDELASADLARRFAQFPALLAQVRIDLYGTLGAGKTTWVRHLLRALGVQGRIKSPTYALLEPYALPDWPGEIFHFDLYRLESEEEWLASGLQETAQSSGLRLIEWPQKAGPALGQPDLALEWHIPAGNDGNNSDNGEARQVQLRTYTSIGRELLENVLKCAP